MDGKHKVKSFMSHLGLRLSQFFVLIGHGFKKAYQALIQALKDIWHDFYHGSIFVKLSFLFLGLGSFRRKQYAKGILLTVFQIVFILYLVFFGIEMLSKMGSLGTVEYAVYYDSILKKNIVNDYDHSFLILLFSVMSIVFILIYLIVALKNIRYQYNLEQKALNNESIDTFIQGAKQFLDEKFHVTLLSLPIGGIIVFTIIPLIFMFLIAFTNYDVNHQPPIKLFQWVGLRNFNTLFSFGQSNLSFGYAFGEIMIWTLIWAFFATVLNYLGGMLLAIFINSKLIKWKKMWRTIFVITIAIPQFVTLMLIKNFFAQQGLVNQLMIEWGVLEFLQNAGIVNSNLSAIPFLTDPVWTRTMLILINCWIGFPYVMLITTGVLMNIPTDLYESARIDGATKFKEFTKITLPYMLFVTAPYLITSFIHNMNNFNVIYLLTYDRATSDQLLAQVDARDTDLLVTWLFRLTAEQANFKMASVIGVVLFIVSVIFTLIAFNLTFRKGKEETFQ